MSPILAGKVAIITGGGSGIGRGIAQAFAKEGCAVGCLDLDRSTAQDTANRIKRGGNTASAHAVDVADKDSCRDAVDLVRGEFGTIDLLVNSAGIFGSGDVLETPPVDWQRCIAVNLTGVFLMSRTVMPDLIDRGGNILNIASAGGLIAMPRAAAYVAAKHGVIGLTKSMALDFGGNGVRVNAICPGPTLTPLTAELYEKAGSGAMERRARTLVLGRLGSPQDIAAVAVHLASSAASWCTGVIYSADGGQALGSTSKPT